ncbi:hypothetical protein N6H14_21195 [Paenibacillus sp. CC-CFT747]|nr:hypothetical protein N6H14_21195 [Paenibacillus sp. CC-CFT747]
MNPSLPRMAKVGLLLDQGASERRWRHGVNVFEFYLEEVLAHGGFLMRC